MITELGWALGLLLWILAPFRSTGTAPSLGGRCAAGPDPHLPLPRIFLFPALGTSLSLWRSQGAGQS